MGRPKGSKNKPKERAVAVDLRPIPEGYRNLDKKILVPLTPSKAVLRGTKMLGLTILDYRQITVAKGK